MYEQLVEDLRGYYRSYSACGDKKAKIAELLKSAADAIEFQNQEIKTQRDILMRYGGETGIRQSEEFASKYWETLAKVPHWVGVEKKLPDGDNDVLVTDGESYAVGYYRPDANAWDSCNFGWLENRHDEDCPPGIETVTHWMPLPPLPYSEKKVNA